MSITPAGAVIFLSQLWGGMNALGLLDLLESGDSVMFDKGVDISDLRDLLKPLKVTLNMPHPKKGL